MPVTSAAGSPPCSGRTAAQLEKRLPVTPFNLGRRLGETLCFDFTGDGRKDIVFTGWVAMNHGAHYWAAYRATRSRWVRVKFKGGCCRADPRTSPGIVIARSDDDIVVSQTIYRPGEPLCCPTGGTRIGVWSWQGKNLALVEVTIDP